MSRTRHPLVALPALRPLALAACLAAAVPPVQAAQGQSQQAEATLPAVTVQARRSEEKAKDLPFTVNVIDDVALEQRRLSRLEDVIRDTPGVEVNSWGGAHNANVRMRGVGSLYQTGADDNSVSVNVDGVPTSVENVSLGTLDVQQVEVLKGPQGTLFGRNSAAGAINVRTNKPVLGRWEGSVRGEAGSKHHHLAEGVINAPLGQTVAARFALRHSARDYWYNNLATGKPLSRPNDLAWRASLLWQPQAATQVTLRASRHDARKYQSGMLVRPYTNPPGQLLYPDTTLAGNHRAINQYALEVQHDLPWARLTSVTSHERVDQKEKNLIGRELNIPQGMDMVIEQHLPFKSKNWHEDLRIASLPGSGVFWVAGLNVSRNDWSSHSIVGDKVRLHDLTHDTNALYGEATWPLGGSGLKFTGGLRYTNERKSYAGLYAPGGALDAQRLRENHLTGRAGLSWALTPQTNLYATLSHGRKAGGFNDNANSAAESRPYRPGKVTSLEAGAKHESADGRLRLDAALFFNRVKDDHLQSFDPATYANWLVNVDTRSKGLELNAHWRAGGGFTLSGGLAWVDGSIRSHAVTNSPAGDVNVGNRLPDVPRLSALLAVQYQRALPAFWGLRSPALNARLSLRHVGKRANDPQNSFDLDAYNKLDLRVGVASGNTELYLWADNLTNRKYELYGYYMGGGASVGLPAPGRTFGLGLVHQF